MAKVILLPRTPPPGIPVRFVALDSRWPRRYGLIYPAVVDVYADALRAIASYDRATDPASGVRLPNGPVFDISDGLIGDLLDADGATWAEKNEKKT